MFDVRSQRFCTWCLGLVALAAASVSAAWAAPRFQPEQAEEATVPSLPSPKTAALFESAARTDDGRVQLLVELQQPSGAAAFARAMQAAPAGDKRRITSAAGAASRRAVATARAEQAAFAPQLQRLGARELYRVARVLNGIAVAVEPGRAKELLRLPGVKRVLPIEAEYPTNSTSVPFIGTPDVWGNTTTPPLPFGADGTGISIGIIDTGTDYMHSNFAGPDLDGGGPGGLGDYQAESTGTTGFTTLGNFPTAKVVGGMDFAGDAYTGSNTPVADPNPMDCNGHGSHVSGTAAGFGVNADGSTYTGPWDNTANFAAMRIGPGTAPQALVYGLRVFGCFGSTGLTTFAIDWAMDPDNDDDVSDHLDVINMSLGSNFGSALSATSVASDNAAIAGVIVVTSAGNAGDTFFISGAPGSASHAIATASSVDDGISAVSVNVNSPPSIAGGYLGGAAAFGPVPSGQTGDGLVATDAVEPPGPGSPPNPAPGTATDACSPLTNAAAMVGKICIADRNRCSFKTKTLNCQNAGAVGVIIVNNAPGSPPPGMADDATIVTPITIPTVQVTLADGTLIKNTITSSPPVNITLLGSNGADTLSSFSSRGPRRIFGSPLRLKPDIAAPGQSITSMQTGKTCLTQTSGGASCTGVAHPSGFQAGNQALTISGTSMASPHIAGTMALLRELHPDWSVDELKALAMNYAVHDVTLFPLAAPPRFGPARIGAGRTDPAQSALGEVIAADADAAGVVSVVFDPEVVVSGPVTQTRTVRVTNKGATQQTYDLAFDNVVDSPGVVYSLPGGPSVTVDPGESEEVDILMTATPSAMDHTRDASLFALQGVQANYGDQPRNFLTEEGSYLTFSQSSVLKLRVPVYMAQRPASTMSAPATITTGLAATGSTTIPLSGADVCTGTYTPGSPSTCTGTFPTDVESLVTPLELQVVSGLDPVNSTDYADIAYVGVGFIPNGGPPSLTTDVIMFGVASHGDWSTPNDVAYNICIDNNEDGIYDRIISNTNPALFVGGAPFNDNFVRVSRNIATNGYSILGTASPVNLVNPSVIDSALHLNNVMVLGATPSLLGITSTADTTFLYKVVTCPATNNGCADTTTGNLCSPSPAVRFDEAAGPYFYNWAAQGLNFGGNFFEDDLNGNSIAVSWNTANMATNGSLGALLLHHHNARGSRAEVVLLEGSQTADLGITKGVTGTQTVGSNVTFTLTVTNNGPDTASGVVVSDFLPPQFDYVSDDGAGAYDPNTGQWTIPGSIANAGTATLNIVATIITSGTACNTATITAGTPLDTIPDNNQDTACVEDVPASADLQLTVVQTPPGSVNAGAALSLAYTLFNNGVDVTHATATFSPAPPVAMTASGPGNPSLGVYTPGSPNTWSVGALPAANNATLTLGATAPDCACFLDVTTASFGSVSDPNAANNTANSHILVLSPATIDVFTKTVAGQFIPGGTVTYTVTIHNNGPYTQQNEAGDEFSDTLPGTLTLVSANDGADPGTIGTAGNTVTWNGAIPSGGTVTITIVATIGVGVTPGTVIANQAHFFADADGDFQTADTDIPSDDPALGGGADATSFTVQAAGLKISKTDNQTTEVPGTPVTYTIVGHNDQLFAVTNETVKDNFPAALTGCTWTCVAGPGSDCDNTAGGTGSAGSGNINEHDVNLAANGTVTYTATCNIAPSATGTLSNTARIHDTGPPITSTDNDTLTPEVDLSITKTDSATSVVAGETTTYTIVVSNSGPSTAAGTSVTDNFPAQCASVSYTSVAAGGATGNTAGPASGNINDTVTVPPGASVTYTAVCTVGSGATGTISNTANVTAAGGTTDTNGANDSATDNDTAITQEADLAISKDDGVTDVPAGSQTTYTIVVDNLAGPSDALGSSVTDNFPTECTAVSWTSVAAGGASGNTAAGTTNINDTVDLPVGSSVTYTVVCTVTGTPGTLANTATVAAAGGVTDNNSANDSDTDTDTIGPAVDVSVTKDDGITSLDAGTQTTYTIVVSNDGPSTATGTSVVDNFPAACASVSYTSVAAGGATGNTAGPASGNVNDTLTLPAGSSVTYTATCTVTSSATGTLSNTVTVDPVEADADSGDDSATDVDTITASADLSITKDDGVTNATPGNNVTYTIVVSNAGPSDSGGTVVDNFPAECVNPTYTSVAAGGASGNTAAGNGNINDVLVLPAGSSVTYTATCPVDANATGSFANTATITAGAVNDPDPSDNSATDVDQAGNGIFSNGFEEGDLSAWDDDSEP